MEYTAEYFEIIAWLEARCADGAATPGFAGDSGAPPTTPIYTAVANDFSLLDSEPIYDTYDDNEAIYDVFADEVTAAIASFHPDNAPISDDTNLITENSNADEVSDGRICTDPSPKLADLSPLNLGDEIGDGDFICDVVGVLLFPIDDDNANLDLEQQQQCVESVVLPHDLLGPEQRAVGGAEAEQLLRDPAHLRAPHLAMAPQHAQSRLEVERFDRPDCYTVIKAIELGMAQDNLVAGRHVDFEYCDLFAAMLVDLELFMLQPEGEKEDTKPEVFAVNQAIQMWLSYISSGMTSTYSMKCFNLHAKTGAVFMGAVCFVFDPGTALDIYCNGGLDSWPPPMSVSIIGSDFALRPAPWPNFVMHMVLVGGFKNSVLLSNVDRVDTGDCLMFICTEKHQLIIGVLVGIGDCFLWDIMFSPSPKQEMMGSVMLLFYGVCGIDSAKVAAEIVCSVMCSNWQYAIDNAHYLVSAFAIRGGHLCQFASVPGLMGIFLKVGKLCWDITWSISFLGSGLLREQVILWCFLRASAFGLIHMTYQGEKQDIIIAVDPGNLSDALCSGGRIHLSGFLASVCPVIAYEYSVVIMDLGNSKVGQFAYISSQESVVAKFCTSLESWPQLVRLSRSNNVTYPVLQLQSGSSIASFLATDWQMHRSYELYIKRWKFCDRETLKPWDPGIYFFQGSIVSCGIYWLSTNTTLQDKLAGSTCTIYSGCHDVDMFWDNGDIAECSKQLWNTSWSVTAEVCIQESQIILLAFVTLHMSSFLTDCPRKGLECLSMTTFYMMYQPEDFMSPFTHQLPHLHFLSMVDRLQTTLLQVTSTNNTDEYIEQHTDLEDIFVAQVDAASKVIGEVPYYPGRFELSVGSGIHEVEPMEQRQLIILTNSSKLLQAWPTELMAAYAYDFFCSWKPP